MFIVGITLILISVILLFVIGIVDNSNVPEQMSVVVSCTFVLAILLAISGIIMVGYGESCYLGMLQCS